MFTRKIKNLPDVFISSKIEPRVSDVHGVGVFAKEKISAREVIERCHLVSFHPETFEVLTSHFDMPHVLESYVFGDYDVSIQDCSCMALGLAMMYNHKSMNERNAMFRFQTNKKTDFRYLEFITVREIEAGEEIFTCYNRDIVGFDDNGATLIGGNVGDGLMEAYMGGFSTRRLQWSDL